jgi:predicted aspartyl protease
VEGHTGLAATVCLIVAVIAHAEPSTQDLTTAIRNWDMEVLQAVAGQISNAGQTALARGVLSEFAGDDAAAIRHLSESILSGQLDDAVRFAAFSELGTVYMRDQQYSLAVSAFESGLKLGGSVTADETNELERALTNARAFSGVPQMTEAVLNHELVPLTRDSMDLPRATADINGYRKDAILDTGAANSVLSVSTAKRLHLHMLRLKGGVTSAGIGRVAAQFGIADTLRVAGYEFRHVPFIVLPDEALTVAVDQGVSTLEPIIGLSVLRRLGQLEILEDDGRESLRVGGSAFKSEMPSNLILAGTLPVVFVQANGDGTHLRMALDTGANRTALAPAAISAYPSLIAGATTGNTKMAGAGGIVANDSATIIPQLFLKIGTGASHLSGVPVSPGPENCDGTLGQDALRSGRGYVIDFVHMTADVLPAVGTR